MSFSIMFGRYLAWSNKPANPRLTISGDAGVGKSRTTFEAIAAIPGVASLTLYTDDEDHALDVARAIANDQNLYAALVADECLDATAFQLAKILQGTQHRVRLITIDNALERMDRTELRLSRIATSTMEKIVEANFPDIDPDRRYRYCQLAEGYLRFAIFLCDNDNLIVQQGHLGTLLGDTKSYLGTLFARDGPLEEADFTALMVISWCSDAASWTMFSQSSNSFVAWGSSIPKKCGSAFIVCRRQKDWWLGLGDISMSPQHRLRWCASKQLGLNGQSLP